MSKHVWTEDMGEISGFGGGYEAACRAMVFAGIDWIAAHPEAKPIFKTYSNITGICSKENDDAKALSEVLLAAAGGDCTGAMHQAAVSHVLYCAAHGWDDYAGKLREREKKKEIPHAR